MIINKIADVLSNKKIQRIVICLIAFIIYSNTLNHELVLDDELYINKNPAVQSGLKGIKDAFTKDVYHWFEVSESSHFYRPLLISSLCIEKALFNNSPGIGHLINVLIYIVSLLILYELMLCFFKENSKAKLIAFFITLFFAAHPLHTEVVANIKSRDELIAFLFGIISFWFLIKYLDHKKQLFFIVSILAYLLALLGKESSVTFLLVFPLIIIYFKRELNIRSTMVLLSPYTIMLIVYILFRQSIMPVPGELTLEMSDNMLIDADVSLRFGTPLAVLLKYLKLLFVPYPLCWDYSYAQLAYHEIYSIEALSSIFIHLIILITGVYFLIKRHIIGFGILFYFITLILTANIFMLVGVNMAERFLFVPLLGFVIILVYIIFKYLKTHIAITINMIICLVFCIMTFDQNKVWKTNLSLFEYGVKISPYSTRTQVGLGGELYRLSRTEKDQNKKLEYINRSIKPLKKSIEIYPENINAQHYLSCVYLDKNKLDSSLFYLKKLQGLKKGHEDGLYNLRVLAWQALNQNKLDIAEEAAHALLKTDSLKFDYIELMAAVKVNQGKLYEAIEYMEELIRSQPLNLKIIKNLIMANKDIGQNDQVFKYEKLLNTFK